MMMKMKMKIKIIFKWALCIIHHLYHLNLKGKINDDEVTFKDEDEDWKVSE